MLAFAVSACGDSVPGNAVAVVDGEAITQSEFNHWINIAQSTSGAPPAGGKTVYKPPEFTACVAKLRTTSPKPAKGQPKPTDAVFKAQCKRDYEQYRDTVLQFLIREKWIRKEAEDQGVKFPTSELNKEFNKIKDAQFKTEPEYQKFLKDAGMTDADAKLNVTYNTLSTKLRDKVNKAADKVTNADIAAYYNKNKKRFAEPEKRDIRVVLTKTKAKADQAKAALDAGQSWKAVTKKFSIDAASKAKGGALEGLPKGNQEKTLDDAIFGAEQGKVTGPVKTQFGYYVFSVQKVVVAKQQSLKQASAAIKQQLETETQTKASTKFGADLEKKWKAKTNCRKGYITQDCKNAPKEKSTPTQPGQVQQGAPQEGAPQQQAPPPETP